MRRKFCDIQTNKCCSTQKKGKPHWNNACGTAKVELNPCLENICSSFGDCSVQSLTGPHIKTSASASRVGTVPLLCLPSAPDFQFKFTVASFSSLFSLRGKTTELQSLRIWILSRNSCFRLFNSFQDCNDLGKQLKIYFFPPPCSLHIVFSNKHHFIRWFSACLFQSNGCAFSWQNIR